MQDLKFRKYENWISKADPDLINTIEAVLPDGRLEMADGEIYTQAELMGSHSYFPSALQQFNETEMFGEGIDPEAKERAMIEMEKSKQTYGLDLATSVEELVQPVNTAVNLPFIGEAVNFNAGPAVIPQYGQTSPGFMPPQIPNQLHNFTAVPQDPIYTALKQMCKYGDSYILPTPEKFKLFLDLFNITDAEKIDELFKQLFREPEIMDAVALDYSTKIMDSMGFKKVPEQSIFLSKVGDTVTGHNIIE